MSIVKTTTDIDSLTINYLTQDMYDDALENNEINERELYITPVSGELANAINYVEFAPTFTNTIGLRVALLDIEPSVKYDGWIYLIKEN